jgi:hypothetical protein
LDFSNIVSEGDETYAIAETGQKVRIEGAVHLVGGPWEGSQALVVEEATTNYCINPQFYNDLGGWYNAGSNPPSSSRITTDCHLGRGCVSVTFGGDNSHFARNYIEDKAAFDGNDVTMSAWVKTSAPNVRLSFQANNASVKSTYSGAHPGDGQWHRLKLTVNATFEQGGSTTFINFGITDADNGTATAYIYEVQVEAQGYATTYCDGDQGYGYSWSGTPHASRSSRTATGLAVPVGGNLDMLSSQSGSLVMWLQLPYDGGGAWGLWGRIWEYGDWSSPITADWIATHFDEDGDGITTAIYRANDESIRDTGWQSVSYAADDWIMLAVAWDSSFLEMYWNGEWLGAIDSPNLFSAYNFDHFLIGAADVSGVSMSNLTCGLLTTFDRALTANEVAALYRVGVSASR